MRAREPSAFGPLADLVESQGRRCSVSSCQRARRGGESGWERGSGRRLARASRRVRVREPIADLIAYRGRREHESERARPDAAGDRRRRWRSQSHVAEPVGGVLSSRRRRATRFDRRHRTTGRTPRRGRGPAAAGAAAPAGRTLFSTLEPCSHHGRTPPCADALIAAGVARVVVGIEDPDPHVGGQGIARLRAAGIEVDGGVSRGRGARPSSRRTSSTGAPVGPTSCSSWRPRSTAAPPRPTARASGSPGRGRAADAHRLRAESDAVLVGAGTVRADDPALTVRHVDAGRATRCGSCSARRPPAPRCSPRSSSTATSATCSTSSAAQGVAAGCWSRAAPPWPHAFHRGRPGRPLRRCTWRRPCSAATTAAALFAGPGAPTIDDVWRGRIVVGRPPRRRPAHRRSDRAGGGLMFTGIVEELGRVARPDDGGARLAHRRRRTVLDDAEHRRRRSRSTAAASRSSTLGDGCVGGRRGRRDARPHQPRRARGPATRSTSSGRCGSPTASAATSCRATSTRVGDDRRAARPTSRCPRCRADAAALRRARRARSPSTASASPSSTPLDDGFTVAVIPHTARGHHARPQGPGRPR